MRAVSTWPKTQGGTLETVFVAHYAQFDRGFIEAAIGGPTSLRWLCTWRLARHLFPEAPSCGNEVLRYWLYPDLELEGLPHRAEHDIAVTSLLLEHMIPIAVAKGIDSPYALIDYAESPVLLTGVLGFGKHHDKTWQQVREIDSGYLHWMRREGVEAWDLDQWHTVNALLGYLV
jgi:exodeoxyribonuclease X